VCPGAEGNVGDEPLRPVILLVNCVGRVTRQESLNTRRHWEKSTADPSASLLSLELNSSQIKSHRAQSADIVDVPFGLLLLCRIPMHIIWTAS
jgi:hypothetical protein